MMRPDRQAQRDRIARTQPRCRLCFQGVEPNPAVRLQRLQVLTPGAEKAGGPDAPSYGPVPEAATPSGPAPEAATPSGPVPEAATPSGPAPEAATPSIPAPEVATPSNPAPESVTPSSSAPQSVTPSRSAPDAATPSSPVLPGRRQLECFLCSKPVQKLTQHLRKKHKLSKQKAAHGVRRHKLETRGSEDARLRLACPRCSSVVIHLDKHLQNSHGLEPKLARRAAALLKTQHPPRPEKARQPPMWQAKEFDKPHSKYSSQLDDFIQWLGVYSTGTRQSRDHVHRVRRVWESTRVSGLGAFSVAGLEGWFHAANRKSAPGTVSAYLWSLNKFLQFCRATGHLKPSAPEREFFQRAWRLVKRQQKDRRAEMRRRDLADKVPAPARKGFVEAAFTVAVYRRAADPCCESTVALMEQLRDCLATEIILFNGSRPSVILNMTKVGVRNNTRADVDGEELRVILVTCHKTAKWHGPARVIVTLTELERLYDLIHMTEELFGDFSKFVFDRPDEYPTSPSWLNKRIQSVWRAAGCLDKYGTLTCTKNRKALTSDMRSWRPEMADDVALQLCHRRRTADRFYLLQRSVPLEEAARRSAATVQQIRRHFL